MLFPDCPHKLVEYNWAIIEDSGTVYGFISSEDKHVPLCKSCGWTAYVSLRGMSGRISCGNFKCKMKLLGEFELSIGEEGKSKGGSSSKFGRRQSQPQPEESKIKEEMSDIDKMMITKAAKRAHN